MRSAIRTDLIVYRRRRWEIRLGALIVAVGMHAALILPMTYGTSMKLLRGQSGSAPLAASGERSVAAIVLLDPSSLSKDEGISASSDDRKKSKGDELGPRLVRFDVSPPRPDGDPDADSHSKTSTSDVDGAQQALIFGRYINQIVARVDRAWVRPDTLPAGVSLWSEVRPVSQSSGTTRFNCRAEILQSTAGAVLEVRLLDCDADPKWQQSLVDAIDAASPLPAPAAQSVFTRSIVVNFTSTVRAAGGKYGETSR